jgi:hypothetical protein
MAERSKALCSGSIRTRTIRSLERGLGSNPSLVSFLFVVFDSNSITWFTLFGVDGGCLGHGLGLGQRSQ